MAPFVIGCYFLPPSRQVKAQVARQTELMLKQEFASSNINGASIHGEEDSSSQSRVSIELLEVASTPPVIHADTESLALPSEDYKISDMQAIDHGPQSINEDDTTGTVVMASSASPSSNGVMVPEQDGAVNVVAPPPPTFLRALLILLVNGRYICTILCYAAITVRMQRPSGSRRLLANRHRSIVCDGSIGVLDAQVSGGRDAHGHWTRDVRHRRRDRIDRDHRRGVRWLDLGLLDATGEQRAQRQREQHDLGVDRARVLLVVVATGVVGVRQHRHGVLLCAHVLWRVLVLCSDLTDQWLESQVSSTDPTHSFTHSLTRSFIHSLAHSSIRSVVDKEHRSFSMTIQIFTIHLLGDFPSPLVVGVRYCHPTCREMSKSSNPTMIHAHTGDCRPLQREGRHDLCVFVDDLWRHLWRYGMDHYLALPTASGQGDCRRGGSQDRRRGRYARNRGASGRGLSRSPRSRSAQSFERMRHQALAHSLPQACV